MIFGFLPSGIRFTSVRVNIISLRQRCNITFATGKNITPSTARHITRFTLCYNTISASRSVNAHRLHIVLFRRTVTEKNGLAFASPFFCLPALRRVISLRGGIRLSAERHLPRQTASRLSSIGLPVRAHLRRRRKGRISFLSFQVFRLSEKKAPTGI